MNFVSLSDTQTPENVALGKFHQNPRQISQRPFRNRKAAQTQSFWAGYSADVWVSEKLSTGKLRADFPLSTLNREKQRNKKSRRVFWRVVALKKGREKVLGLGWGVGGSEIGLALMLGPLP